MGGSKGRQRPPSGGDGNRSLAVEVVWGDITKAEGDVHVVGHYVGVKPQNAEFVLDKAISGIQGTVGDADLPRMLLTDLTNRGALRGALGEVNFFPWGKDRVLAVAGMGRPGTFEEAQLRVLARSVAQSVGRLVDLPTVSSVLIGSGAGNMPVPRAVSGLVSGFLEALVANRELRVRTLRIVELNLDRALEILDIVTGKTAPGGPWHDRVAPASRLVEEGGRIPPTFGYSMLLAAIANSGGLPKTSKTRAALRSIIDELPPGSLPADLQENLDKLCELKKDLRGLALQLRIDSGRSVDVTSQPSRLTFSTDGREIHGSAITDTATVMDRALSVPPVLDRAIERLQKPAVDKAEDYGAGLFRLIVHQDLYEVLQDHVNPLVVEVDRHMARVQWEMLPGRVQDHTPLGVQRPIARQLRTQYSPRPVDVPHRQGSRALVIGDPGDPDQSLMFARKEAEAVATILEKRGLQVELRVGPPDILTGGGRVEGQHGVRKGKLLPPADLLEVLDLLLSGDFDLVHYTGHGLFDPSAPERSGWLFAERELLTASQLAGMSRPPALIVANACLTAQLSDKRTGETAAPAGGKTVRVPRPDVQLVASLADEFFKRGVADYIGTAWEVPDGPATTFAQVFYERLLPTDAKSPRVTLGEALQAARKELFKHRTEEGYGAVWGAYQHYGDPARVPRLK